MINPIDILNMQEDPENATNYVSAEFLDEFTDNKGDDDDTDEQ